MAGEALDAAKPQRFRFGLQCCCSKVTAQPKQRNSILVVEARGIQIERGLRSPADCRSRKAADDGSLTFRRPSFGGFICLPQWRQTCATYPGGRAIFTASSSLALYCLLLF